MAETAKFFLVEAGALPSVFLAVVEAKEALHSGKARSASEAARMAGISRSAFYKYKDSVFAYHEGATGQIVTLSMILRDRPGVLAPVIAAFHRAGANILTIHQNIPVSGAAPVSVSANTDGMTVPLTELLAALWAIDGVQSIQNITGESAG